MKKTLTVLSTLSIILLLWGCPDGLQKHNYRDATFPLHPQNLKDVNSEFDDYNSALPETHYGKQLIFSSNRRNSGKSFDIIGDRLHAVWYWDEEKLIVDNSSYWQNTTFVGDMLRDIEKEGNQFAPYFISFDSLIGGEMHRVHLLAYSTNAFSNCYRSEFLFDITDINNENGDISSTFEIKSLGNCSQQQYVSFYGRLVEYLDVWELNPNNFTQMYFDETTDGNSDIYKTDIPDSLNFMQFLMADTAFEKEAASTLNSDYNDRCPFINGDYMVFSSDRPGGFGGYDLYYSFFRNGEWTEPIIFGEEINSEYDEFRPVVAQVFEYQNDLMVFSSNRPGGLGGFDLYYVGIDKLHPLQLPD